MGGPAIRIQDSGGKVQILELTFKHHSYTSIKKDSGGKTERDPTHCLEK